MSSVPALRQRVLQWYLHHPPLATGVRQALAAVEEAVLEAEELGEVFYPRDGDREGVTFHPGYGLLPDDQGVRWTRVSRDQERFHKILLILNTMRRLVAGGRRTTKRDIFYDNFTEFSSQAEVDRMVAEVVTMLQVPRLQLGVMATSKGLVVGHLAYTNSEGVTVDLRLAVGGDTIPQDVPEVELLGSDAHFLLVVEKDAIFQRLLEEGVMTGILPPFVMVTGKGMPDLATRQLVYRLSTELLLPTFLLTDCDPYGLEIGLTYKFGSLAMAWAPERLAVPSATLLGLLPSDVARLAIPPASMREFSEEDWKKVQDLHDRDYVREACPLLVGELEALWQLGRKAEIQQVSEEREEGFLVRSYLPERMVFAEGRAARGAAML